MCGIVFKSTAFDIESRPTYGSRAWSLSSRTHSHRITFRACARYTDTQIGWDLLAWLRHHGRCPCECAAGNVIIVVALRRHSWGRQRVAVFALPKIIRGFVVIVVVLSMRIIHIIYRRTWGCQVWFGFPVNMETFILNV